MDYIPLMTALGAGGLLGEGVRWLRDRAVQRQTTATTMTAAVVTTEGALVQSLSEIAQQDRSKLWEQIGVLRARLDAAQAAANKANEALLDLQRQLNEAHLRIETLQAENESMHEERETLRSEVTLLRAELAQFKAATVPAPA